MKFDEIKHQLILGLLVIVFIAVILTRPAQQAGLAATFNECIPAGRACVGSSYITCQDGTNGFLNMQETVCLYGCDADGCRTEKAPVVQSPTQFGTTPTQQAPSPTDIQQQSALPAAIVQGTSQGLSAHPAQVQVVDKSKGQAGPDFQLGDCEGTLLTTVTWNPERALCRKDAWTDIKRGYITAASCCQVIGDTRSICGVFGELVPNQGPGVEFNYLECYG